MKSEEIAKLAGVSRSTVSRVVNNYPNVPEKTRKKVQKVIDKYGYVPDTVARSLAGKRNKVIGLFIIDNMVQREEEYSVHDSPYLSQFLSYSTDAAEERDYNILVSVINKESKYSKFIKMLNSSIISGAIIVGGETRKDIVGKIILSKTKVVFVDEPLDGEYPNIVHLNSDNYKGAYLATEELIKNGHIKIGHITGNLEKYDARERLRGYKDCLRDHGLQFDEKYLTVGDFRFESGYIAMKQMKTQCGEDLPTAIFVGNDQMAVTAIEYMKEINILVPEDVSVIGFDNEKFNDYVTNDLTTIFRSVKEQAKKSVNMIIDFIEQDDKKLINNKNIEIELIRKKSVKKMN